MATIAVSAVGASATGDLPGYRTTTQAELLDLIEAYGHRLVEPDSSEATHFVALDHNRTSLKTISDRIPKENRQLVIFEPRVVIPGNYHARVHSHYAHLISMTPDYALDWNAPFLPWPQRDWRAQPPAAGTHIPGTTALINSNKLSSIRGSLYGLRRRVINEFSREELPLTVAGSNWTRRGRALFVENCRSVAYALLNREPVDWSEWAGPLDIRGSVDHIGIVEDKESVFLTSEFAVVIENSATYVSEKLFDAVIAGCVPLYVGPPLEIFGIPAGVAITLKQQPSAFVNAVRTLSDEEKRNVLEAGRDWLADDAAHSRWAMHNALVHLAENIHSHVDS